MTSQHLTQRCSNGHLLKRLFCVVTLVSSVVVVVEAQDQLSLQQRIVFGLTDLIGGAIQGTVEGVARLFGAVKNSVHDIQHDGVAQWSKKVACRAANIECCLAPDIRPHNFIRNLEERLNKEFFAQHLATENVLNAIAAHWNGNPRRPLVLSFHGWTGSGKTYLAQIIVNTLFRKGEESQFYKHFTHGYDFYDHRDESLEGIQSRLHADLLLVAKRCEYAVFVFDEVQQISPKVLDALVPFVDYPGVVNGVSFKKAIFIFLGNMGSQVITETTFNAWKAGKSRETLKMKDFESAINLRSFNEKASGLYRSKLIDKSLIDHTIPFLPMEKHHVKLCIMEEASRQGVLISPVEVDEIADNLEYWPEETPLFSKSGCKKVERTVALWISKHRRTEL